jgi:MFS family permease
MDWNWDLYFRLSGLMFLEFAIWGVWMPVLAMRLLGPLKMTGKQTGWIYATLPLACVFAPLASGYMADKWFNAEWIMLACHAVGAVLLVVAARQTKFWGMLWVMLAYSICFTATLPLVNKQLFAQYPEKATSVFFWAPVAWALIGYFLTGLRHARRSGGDGPDSLYVAAVLSALMVVVCYLQKALPPSSQGNPMMEALAMLGNTNYLVFMVAALVVSGMVQFYFLGTGQFLQDRGMQGKNVSAIMAFAQAVQALATIYLLDPLIGETSFKWTLAIGALCWTILYSTYIASNRTLILAVFQAFHGLAYVFFMIGAQKFVAAMAPQAIGASAQSLIFIATVGIGPFLGTQLAGYVMEKNSVAGKFQWSKIWAVPLAITLAGAIVFAGPFKEPKAEEFKAAPAKAETAVALAAMR